MFSVITLGFDGFLNKKRHMHTEWCFCTFFFVISSKNVLKFGYLVFFAGINFREIAQNLRNSQKLLPAKITSFY